MTGACAWRRSVLGGRPRLLLGGQRCGPVTSHLHEPTVVTAPTAEQMETRERTQLRSHPPVHQRPRAGVAWGSASHSPSTATIRRDLCSHVLKHPCLSSSHLLLLPCCSFPSLCAGTAVSSWSHTRLPVLPSLCCGAAWNKDPKPR